MQHDDTGKASFDDIYVAPDPRPYFRTLRQFDYAIPATARPQFARLVSSYSATRSVARPTLLDIGCSYGINAALLRCDVSLAELYERYSVDDVRSVLVSADRALVAGRPSGLPVRLVGMDTSAPALGYALEAGFLDDGVVADLESGEPTDAQRSVLGGVDLVVSTGCLGYVTEKTLQRVVEARSGSLPWMAHYCLRMFPFDPIADRLDDLGYTTTAVGAPERQRRFASSTERDLVLARLGELDLPVSAHEADGWLYAQLFVSVPKGER